VDRKPNENFSRRNVGKKNPKQGKEPQNANPYREEVDKLNDKTFETIPYWFSRQLIGFTTPTP